VVRRRALALTRRRSSYRSINSLQRDNRVCRACVEAGSPLESLPVVLGYAGQRAYMFGQAPGIVEGLERRPWRGRAGQTLRRWLGMDEDEFYATFYCASVTRCYPGRARSGGGDRTPTAREQALCSFWREWEFELLRPKLIVVVGGLAARRLLGLKSLDDAIGRKFPADDAVAVPLPHPSGVSRWLNDPANRQTLDLAVALVHEELEKLGDRTAAP
jgi:uracil-DNA glycosylase family 4